MPKHTGIPLARPAKVPPAPDGFTAVTPNEWLPIWDRVITTTPTKAVGYAVARFAGWKDGGNVRPGNAILARMCGCSDKSVRVALGQMREWGLLWRYHKGMRQGDADIYRLTFPDDALAKIPLLDLDWELPEPPTAAVAATAAVPLAGAVAESAAAVAPAGALRYELPPTSTKTSPGTPYDDGEGFDLADAEVAHAREVKIATLDSGQKQQLEAVQLPFSAECPYCGAERGSPCLNSGTGKPTRPHDARLSAAAEHAPPVAEAS